MFLTLINLEKAELSSSGFKECWDKPINQIKQISVYRLTYILINEI